ncbi:HPr family phosphocarrier protein [Clostridium vitabionis]|jgi:phosphocarrier protein HPr|uniref:HPr family phosphocarrier protein n=1 Tax=Clostridium vitabionis TaxID=2784388 RepID=UPI00188DB3EE|nr:HPr family phosphocarrier protein [Clostridium vitabionis]
MRKFSFILSAGAPVHARPAGKMVRMAKKFSSRITLTCGGRTSSCKCLVSVMRLDMRPGCAVTVQAEGPDEEEAYRAMKKFILEDFQNGEF